MKLFQPSPPLPPVYCSLPVLSSSSSLHNSDSVQPSNDPSLFQPFYWMHVFPPPKLLLLASPTPFYPLAPLLRYYPTSPCPHSPSLTNSYQDGQNAACGVFLINAAMARQLQQRSNDISATVLQFLLGGNSLCICQMPFFPPGSCLN